MSEHLHVALVHDGEVLDQESFSLDRLAIGLTGDGERVLRVVPSTHAELLGPPGLVRHLPVEMRAVPWRRRARIESVLRAIERTPPEVVVVRGRSMWSIAADLATACRAPLAVEVWRSDEVVALGRFARRRGKMRTAGETPADPATSDRSPSKPPAADVAAALAPTEALAAMLRTAVEPKRVHLVPAGVAVPPRPRPVLEAPDTNIAIAVLGPVNQPAAWRALLTALARVTRDRPSVHVFVELVGPGSREVWRDLRRLDLLGRVTCLDGLARFRRLLLGCDMLIMPEPLGGVRSLVLAAMAVGIPVLAAADPCLDTLVDGETADVADQPDVETWATMLSWRLDDPVGARALGLRGRSLVERRHRSTGTVATLAEVLRELRSAAAEATQPAARGATAPKAVAGSGTTAAGD